MMAKIKKESITRAERGSDEIQEHFHDGESQEEHKVLEDPQQADSNHDDHNCHDVRSHYDYHNQYDGRNHYDCRIDRRIYPHNRKDQNLFHICIYLICT